MLTVALASQILKRPKRLVAGMSWVKKLNRDAGNWLEFNSAIEFEDDGSFTPEGLLVRGYWSPSQGARPENYGFSFFVGNDRIYAIDVKPAGRHTNNAGLGRALHKQKISGTHEHTWSEDGCGYAEPIETVDMKSTWNHFVLAATISKSQLKYPDNGLIRLL